MSSNYFLVHKYYRIKYNSYIKNHYNPQTGNVTIGLQRNSWWARLSGDRVASPKVFFLLLGACYEPEGGHLFENDKAAIKSLVLMSEIQYNGKEKKYKAVSVLMFHLYSYVLYQGGRQ